MRDLCWLLLSLYHEWFDGELAMRIQCIAALPEWETLEELGNNERAMFPLFRNSTNPWVVLLRAQRTKHRFVGTEKEWSWLTYGWFEVAHICPEKFDDVFYYQVSHLLDWLPNQATDMRMEIHESADHVCGSLPSVSRLRIWTIQVEPKPLVGVWPQLHTLWYGQWLTYMYNFRQPPDRKRTISFRTFPNLRRLVMQCLDVMLLDWDEATSLETLECCRVCISNLPVIGTTPLFPALRTLRCTEFYPWMEVLAAQLTTLTVEEPSVLQTAFPRVTSLTTRFSFPSVYHEFPSLHTWSIDFRSVINFPLPSIPRYVPHLKVISTLERTTTQWILSKPLALWLDRVNSEDVVYVHEERESILRQGKEWSVDVIVKC